MPIPANGVCATESGACTLRAAIQESNALSGADIITLPAGTYTLTIPGAEEEFAATGDLDILDDLTINGAGAAVTIIDANGLDRIFDWCFPALAISGITVTHGEAFGGGGIRHVGSLTVTSCIIRDNRSNSDGGGLEAFSLPIPVQPRLTLIDSIVTGNSTQSFPGNGGGIRAEGFTGRLIITRNEISHNACSSSFTAGGGISAGVFMEPPILTEVTVTDNSAARGGGY
jgi:large repetitive protein